MDRQDGAAELAAGCRAAASAHRLSRQRWHRGCARRLDLSGEGLNTYDLLDRVARSAAYDHWHHVTLCLKEFEAKSGLDALNAECDLIISAAREGKTKIIVTGPETLTVPLVLFACQGDAWLLDAEEGMATSLVWQGEPQDREIEDVGNNIEVGWDGAFALDGDAFAVETEHPAIGTRRIFGYPLDELRQAIDKAQSFDKRFGTIIAQEDAVDLTPELTARLLAQGWEPKVIEDGVGDGARYSPSRNSLLYPQMFG